MLGGSFSLETKTMDLDTGEIVSEDLVVRPGFAWDNAVEAALDDAIKRAKDAGVENVRIDSPFYKSIQARRQLLKELEE
jgi:hypothetical protein